MISAIVLAAGQSTRMGRQKMLLPWRNTTVLEHVIATIQAAGIKDVLVVTGSEQGEIEKLAGRANARATFNEKFASEEMLASIQCGLRAQRPEAEATFICLGDQPQVQEGTVRRVRDAYQQSHSSIIVPSHKMRRGHPWLVARSLWKELLELGSEFSPRDFMKVHEAEIEYLVIDTPSIIEDLDTLEDYLKFKPSV
jgi:molybdenum cofactor cytidylyltransferase